MRMTRLPALVLALLLPGVAHAGGDLEAAKQAFSRGEFRTTLARMEEAARSPTITEDDLVDIHWYRGASYFALGKRDLADREFDALLGLRPLYAPNRLETPPDVRAAFKKRSEAYAEKRGVTLGEPLLGDGRIRVTVDAVQPEPFTVLVFARNAGDVRYAQFELPLEGRAAAGLIRDRALWERAGKDGKVQVVVEVRNARGTPVARAGDAQQPLELAVTAAAAEAAARQAGAAEKQAAPAENAPRKEPASTEGGNATAQDKGTQDKAASDKTASDKTSADKTSTDKPASKQAGDAATGTGGKATEDETSGGGGGGPLGFILVGAGAGALALSVLPALWFLASGVGGALSGALMGYTLLQVNTPGSDKQRAELEQRWQLSQVGVAVLVPSAVLGFIVGATLGILGLVLVVARAAV